MAIKKHIDMDANLSMEKSYKPINPESKVIIFMRHGKSGGLSYKANIYYFIKRIFKKILRPNSFSRRWISNNTNGLNTYIDDSDSIYQNTSYSKFMRLMLHKVDPPLAKSDNQINAGIYVFKNEIFDAIKSTKKSSRGEFEITDSINQLIKNGEKIRTALLNNEEWMDIGNPWDLLDANKRSLDETKH